MRKAPARWMLVGTSLMMSNYASAQVTSPQTGNDATNGSTAVDVGAAKEDASAGPSASTQPDSSRLDEIIVTAQRRSENLTSVPLSITASTGKALAASGITTLTDLKFTTPGYVTQTEGGFTQIFIRGIGNNIFVGADPSIATFVDDVPRTYATLVDDLVNVERVEVLKGAQGGLYGRNATGGVINVITRQPGQKPEMQARISFGTRKTLNVAGYVNLPISDRLAVNLSITRRYHDPYLRNLSPEMPYPSGTTIFFGTADPNSTVRRSRLNDQDFWSIDGKVRAQLAENFKVTLSGDYSRKHDADGNGWSNRTPDALYAAYLGYAQAAGLMRDGIPYALPRSAFFVPGKFKGYGAIDSYSYSEDYGTAAKAELGLDGLDVTSITAFRWNNTNYQGDIGATIVPLVGFQSAFERRSFYQEVRAVSNGSGPFHYLGGATYFRDHIDGFLQGLFFGFPSGGPTTSVLKTRSYSVFGQGAYDLTDQLTLTGSLRYVEERKNVFFPVQSGNPAQTVLVKSHKLIPSATLSYKVSGGTIYARYAKGFKTGGVNPITSPSQIGIGNPGSIFRPEEVDLYEVGYRAQLFDRKVQFTSALFYNKYANLQVVATGNVNNPQIAQVILNAGNSRTYGAEASLTWRIAPPLTVSGNIGYLNAKLIRYTFAGNNVVDPINFSGNRNAIAPKWQGGASVNLDQPISDRYRLLASGIAGYVSQYYFVSDNDPKDQSDSYWQVNTRVGIATVDDRLGAYVFVNNLFNKQYFVFGNRSGAGVYQVPGAPRVVGGTIEMKF